MSIRLYACRCTRPPNVHASADLPNTLTLTPMCLCVCMRLLTRFSAPSARSALRALGRAWGRVRVTSRIAHVKLTTLRRVELLEDERLPSELALADAAFRSLDDLVPLSRRAETSSSSPSPPSPSPPSKSSSRSSPPRRAPCTPAEALAPEACVRYGQAASVSVRASASASATVRVRVRVGRPRLGACGDRPLVRRFGWLCVSSGVVLGGGCGECV